MNGIHTPMRRDGTTVRLANGAGGFDVHGCPDALVLAQSIVTGCNAHNSFADALRAIAAGHGCPSALATDTLAAAGVA